MILQTTLSDAELSRLVGLSRKTVADWRRGRMAPSSTRATELAWLDLIARASNPIIFATITIARYRVDVATDDDSLTTVTVDGHTATGWCGSGVCLLRLVSEAIRLAERQEVAP